MGETYMSGDSYPAVPIITVLNRVQKVLSDPAAESD